MPLLSKVTAHMTLVLALCKGPTAFQRQRQVVCGQPCYTDLTLTFPTAALIMCRVLLMDSLVMFCACCMSVAHAKNERTVQAVNRDLLDSA